MGAALYTVFNHLIWSLPAYHAHYGSFCFLPHNGMVADGVGLGTGAIFPTASLGSVGLSGLLWAFPCCICVHTEFVGLTRGKIKHTKSSIDSGCLVFFCFVFVSFFQNLLNSTKHAQFVSLKMS